MAKAEGLHIMHIYMYIFLSIIIILKNERIEVSCILLVVWKIIPFFNFSNQIKQKSRCGSSGFYAILYEYYAIRRAAEFSHMLRIILLIIGFIFNFLCGAKLTTEKRIKQINSHFFLKRASDISFCTAPLNLQRALLNLLHHSFSA